MSALDTYRDLRRLREWIESHGFTARIVHGKIEIEIPWVCANTGSSGFDVYTVNTHAAARQILGY